MCAGTTMATFPQGIPIIADAFTHAIPGGPGGTRGTITGIFTARSLNGSLSFEVVPIPNTPSCTGSAEVTYSASPG